MTDARITLLSLVALVTGGAGAFVLHEAGSEEVRLLSTAPGVIVDVRVTGPGGEAVFTAVALFVEPPTPLGALEAAAARGGFMVEKRESSYGTYVEAVDGHRASGAAGWEYWVLRGSEWRWGDRAADLVRLAEGDVVEWRWVESPSESR